MLVRLTELIQTDGFYEESTRTIAIDPVAIESIKPGELQGCDGPCCVIVANCEESPLYVSGDLESVLERLQAAEETATQKLAAIREIIEDGGE